MGGMPIPPEPRPDQPDEPAAAAPVPGTGSVLFSHAPAPEPEPSGGAAGAEQTGWPWFLPQDGLRRDHLAGAVDAETDPAGAAAAYAQIPLVAAATALLEHVGDGREVTADGGLPLAEVHALLDAWQLDPGGQELTTMWQVGEIAGPWNALLSGGWLTVTGTRVHPADGVTPAASPTQDPAAFVRFARALTLLLVLDALRQEPAGASRAPRCSRPRRRRRPRPPSPASPVRCPCCWCSMRCGRIPSAAACSGTRTPSQPSCTPSPPRASRSRPRSGSRSIAAWSRRTPPATPTWTRSSGTGAPRATSRRWPPTVCCTARSRPTGRRTAGAAPSRRWSRSSARWRWPTTPTPRGDRRIRCLSCA